MFLEGDAVDFVLSSMNDIHDARYVVFGVEDEGGSADRAPYKGSSEGPASIRQASHDLASFHRQENGEEVTHLVNSYHPIETISLYDIGNIHKEEISSAVFSCRKRHQFPFMIGGDHSLTYEVLRGLDREKKEYAIVYFDAHPDCLSSEKNGKSYGTVLYDAAQLQYFNPKKSILVGIRDCESEEFNNLDSFGFHSITNLGYAELGLKKTLDAIQQITRDVPLYISVDLDVVDRSIAPGVSTPSPCGLTSLELLYLFTGLAGSNVIGCDVVEHVPSQDIHRTTAHLGAKLMIEFIVRHNSFELQNRL